MHANKREEISEVYAGDIAAGIGIKKVTTGNTLCDPEYRLALEAMTFPEPVVDVAIEPKSKVDEEKLSHALQRLSEEDPTFRVRTDEETGQTVISGMGELHLEILVDRMKREFSVEANVGKPQVAYKETISVPAEVRHRFVRQTGGHGMFADVTLRVEPQVAGKGFEFESRIVGGAIPKEYIPAVERGVEEAMRAACWPATRWWTSRCRCSTARTTRSTRPRWRSRSPASMAFKEACAKAKPRLLEPIFDVEVVVPEEYMGDIIGDLSSRRGRIGGMFTRVRGACHRGLGAAGGDVRIRDADALDFAGARRVLHAVLTLRNAAAVGGGRDRREGRGARPGSHPARCVVPDDGGKVHGQAEVRAHEAARERGDDRARGPREDDVDGGDHEGAGAEEPEDLGAGRTTRSTTRRKRRRAGSRSRRRTWSTRRRSGTTRTWIARGTRTT